jgi:hypothetical protein
VESNDLVTKDVLAGSNVLGNSDSPGVAVRNQVVGSPALSSGIIESLLVNLEEGKVASRGRSGIIDAGEVIQYRTFVQVSFVSQTSYWAVFGSYRGDSQA